MHKLESVLVNDLIVDGSTLAKEFTAVTCIMQSSSNELSTGIR